MFSALDWNVQCKVQLSAIPFCYRGGPWTSDHVDVLGNHGLLDLLLHVATGHGDEVSMHLSHAAKSVEQSSVCGQRIRMACGGPRHWVFSNAYLRVFKRDRLPAAAGVHELPCQLLSACALPQCGFLAGFLCVLQPASTSCPSCLQVEDEIYSDIDDIAGKIKWE